MKSDHQFNSLELPRNGGIVGDRADSGKPSLEDCERMARRRFQAPKPKREGEWWYIRPWRDELVGGKVVRKRVRIKLAPASMAFREVQKEAAERLRPMNQGLETGSAANLKEFLTTTYIPTVLPSLAKSTQGCYSAILHKYVEGTLGNRAFRELTPTFLRRHFFGMVTAGIAHPTIVKVRNALSGVLRSAAENGLLIRNPLDGLKLPPDRRPRRRKPVLSPEEFGRLVEALSEPYATMVFTAVWTGLRVSELIGLKWHCIHADSITVEERYWRGDWAAPKTDASAATIGVEPQVIERIQRLVVKSHGPDDLVFQSVRAGKPMNDQNILRRFLKPAAKTAGVPFVDWRCLRRSYATWLIQAGADPKSVQGQLRHSRISTTMDIYAQIVPAAQRRAVEKLSEFVGKPVPRSVPLLVQ